MSIWNDIRRRGNGIDLKKEDAYPCYVTIIQVGKGTKLPKKCSVPTDIRMQKIWVVISPCPLDSDVEIPDGYAAYENYIWTYKVGERDLDKVEDMLNNLKEEFGDLTYIFDKEGEAILTDKSEKMLEEFTKRIKKHNEDVCGIPLRNISRFQDNWL